MTNNFSTTVIANPFVPETDPGNSLTVSVGVVGTESFSKDTSIGFHIEVNDGHLHNEDCGDHDHEDIPNTELYFKMPTKDAEEFAKRLGLVIDDAKAIELRSMSLMLDFKSAQLACAKGEVDRVVITLLPDQDEKDGLSGLDFKLTYVSLEGDERTVAEIEKIELMFPFAPSEQNEFFRTIIGGKHQNTQSIEIACSGFTVAGLNERMAKALQRN